jgi:four helix bundle protein
MHIRPYQKLIVWKEAHELCKWVYGITGDYPSVERYRLVDQLCRSSSSVPTNIAEGSTMRSPKERYRYYEIASSSLEEVHYELLLSKDIGYISDTDFDIADDKIKRISYLIRKLQGSL